MYLIISKKNDIEKAKQFLFDIYGETVECIYRNILNIPIWRLKRSILTNIEYKKLLELCTKDFKQEKTKEYTLNDKIIDIRKIKIDQNDDKFIQFMIRYQRNKKKFLKRWITERDEFEKNNKI